MAATRIAQGDQTMLTQLQELNEYNGYTNYPTWLIAYFVRDTQERDTYWIERVRCVLKDKLALGISVKSAENATVGIIAQELQGSFNDREVVNVVSVRGSMYVNCPRMKKFCTSGNDVALNVSDLLSPFTDLLQWALQYVDWFEVANTLLEAAKDA